MTSLNLGENEIAFPGLGIDKLTVKSKVGVGTTVTMQKKISRR